MIQSIIANEPDWIQALSVLIAAASVIAAATPTPKDDTAIGKAYKIVDLLAVNFGNAKK